jgi:hypothetical protein
MPSIDNLKHFALLEEFETSYKLIKLGLGELQNLNGDNSFYFLPFQLLSQGFERYMKAYICVSHNHKHNKLPTHKYLKGIGHDLEKLIKEILENYYLKFDRPQFTLDYSFLNSNSDLKELLYILSEFGKLARYYNFDLITDNERIGIDTKGLWEKFENKILTTEDLKKLFGSESDHEVYFKISNHIVIVFEKFISALSR